MADLKQRHLYKEPARRGSKSSPGDGLLAQKERNAVCQLIKLEATEASLNMGVSNEHTSSQKAGYFHSESHPEIRILEQVAYLRETPRDSSIRVENSKGIGRKPMKDIFSRKIMKA